MQTFCSDALHFLAVEINLILSRYYRIQIMIATVQNSKKPYRFKKIEITISGTILELVIV